MEENGENTLIVKNSRVMYKHFFKRFLDFVDSINRHIAYLISGDDMAALCK